MTKAESVMDALRTEIYGQMGRRRMSAAKLARQLGRSQSGLNEILNGKSTMTVDLLVQIAHVLGTTAARLLTAAEPQPRDHDLMSRLSAESERRRGDPPADSASSGPSGY